MALVVWVEMEIVCTGCGNTVGLAAPSAVRGSQAVSEQYAGHEHRGGKDPQKAWTCGRGSQGGGQGSQSVKRSSRQMGVSIAVSGHQVVWVGGWDPKTPAGLKRDGTGVWAQAAAIGNKFIVFPRGTYLGRGGGHKTDR